MSCTTARCPINGQNCEGCTNNEEPADGPDPRMSNGETLPQRGK